MRPRPRSTQHVAFAVASLIVAASFVGCPFLKKKGGDDEGVGDAATVSVSGTGAKNEANVLRYANETPIANEPAIIGKEGAVARNFPGNGPEVATLAKGTVVAKIASYFSTGVLIMFDDPSGDGSKLLGWVSPKAFDVAAPAPTKTIFVPPKPKDAGVVADAGGAAPVADAGGGGAKDAGAAPATDAGGANPFATCTAKAIACSSVDGKCPDGWAIDNKMCKHKCTKDGDPICPRTTKCVAGGGGKICSSGN